MKVNFNHIVIAASFAALICASDVNGQDASFGDYESTDNDRDRSEGERILYSPGEGELRHTPKNSTPASATGSSTVKDTPKEKETESKQTPAPAKSKIESTSKSTEKAPVVQPKSNGESEIPSFNFLYYIIQKYKLQDIID